MYRTVRLRTVPYITLIYYGTVPYRYQYRYINIVEITSHHEICSSRMQLPNRTDHDLGWIKAPPLVDGLCLSLPPNHHGLDLVGLDCLPWERIDYPNPPVRYFGTEARAGPPRIPTILSWQPITEWSSHWGDCKTPSITSSVGQATSAPASSWRWLFLLLAIVAARIRRPDQDPS